MSINRYSLCQGTMNPPEGSVKNHPRKLIQQVSNVSINQPSSNDVPLIFDARIGRNEKRHLQPTLGSQRSLDNNLVSTTSGPGGISYNNKTLLFANAVLQQNLMVSNAELPPQEDLTPTAMQMQSNANHHSQHRRSLVHNQTGGNFK